MGVELFLVLLLEEADSEKTDTAIALLEISESECLPRPLALRTRVLLTCNLGTVTFLVEQEIRKTHLPRIRELYFHGETAGLWSPFRGVCWLCSFSRHSREV